MTGPLLTTPPQSSRSLFALARSIGESTIGRMRLPRLLEAADPFVHVPAERADDADVVVVPHVAVGDDVEAGFFLIADHRRDGVVVGLFVLDFLERDADVAAEQLVLEPLRSRIRSDHGRRKNGVDDLFGHFGVLLRWRVTVYDFRLFVVNPKSYPSVTRHVKRQHFLGVVLIRGRLPELPEFASNFLF